jgi:hypothetical protein
VIAQKFVNASLVSSGIGHASSPGASLKALRARAESQHKHLVLSSARKAINEAREAQAASEFMTIAAALRRIDNGTLDSTRDTVIVVAEAAMTGDRALHSVLTAAAHGRSKLILVGDSRPLQPARVGGGLFRDLAEQLPWAQSIDYV